jgi:hypothetical protein
MTHGEIRMRNGAGQRIGLRWPAVVPGALRVAAALLAIAALSACTAFGYRLGSTLPPDIRYVHVPGVINKTHEPQMEAEITRAIIEEIQKDGNLRVVARERADSILEVTLKEYEQVPLRYDRREATLAREFRMKVTALVVFRRTATNAVLVDRPVVGEAVFEATGDLSGPKRDALPRLAQDLAHQVLKCVVEYW